MIKKTSKKSEFKHFTNLAEEWWDPDGKFGILHNLTPIRIEYIKKIYLKNNTKHNKAAKPLANTNILDLGCGGGLICEPLAKLGAKVTGVDFIKENIEIAKKHSIESSLNIDYVHQNLNYLNLKKKFDLILVLEVLEHLSDWKKLILNIKKLLNKKGILIISTINKNIFSKIFAIYIAENILKWIPKNTHHYEKFIRPEELINHLNKNNFNIIDITGLIFNPITLDWKLNEKRKKINYFCAASKY